MKEIYDKIIENKEIDPSLVCFLIKEIIFYRIYLKNLELNLNCLILSLGKRFLTCSSKILPNIMLLNYL